MSKRRSDEVDRYAAGFKALSSPQRLRIFLTLVRCCAAPSCDGAGAPARGMRRCVGDLVAALDIAPSTLSHHLKELRQAGLMRVERRGRSIECWICRDTVHELAAFLAGPAPARARRR